MPRQRRKGQFNQPRYNQAAKVIRRFGGERALAEALGVARTTPYKWGLKAPYGRDGLIPTRMIDRIKQVARLHGVLLRESDWTPEVITYEEKETTA